MWITERLFIYSHHWISPYDLAGHTNKSRIDHTQHTCTHAVWTNIECYGGHVPVRSKDAVTEQPATRGHSPLNGVQCVYVSTVGVGVLSVRCLGHSLPGVAA